MEDESAPLLGKPPGNRQRASSSQIQDDLEVEVSGLNGSTEGQVYIPTL